MIPAVVARSATAEEASEDPNATVSLLSARSLETDGDSEEDADFDPVKSGDEASSDDEDDDGSSDDDEDAAGEDDEDASDDDEVARAVKASFLRSFGESDATDDRAVETAAVTVVGDAAADDNALPLGDAEMEELFDTDESDTDEDYSEDEDEDVSLVPEDSNVLNASTGLLVPGSEYSPSASVSAVPRPPVEKGARASPAKSVPRELFVYSPSLKRLAREQEETLEAKSKRSKPTDAESPAPRAGARRALAFDSAAVLRSVKESGGGGDVEGSDDPPRQCLPKPFIGSLEDSDDESENRGVARRTRAHISLADIDLDYIESMMPLPDEGDMGFQFHDDDEEYANFLSAINLDFEVGGDAAAGGEKNARQPLATLRDDDDESDDDDYANVDPKAARVERRARRYQAANAPILAAATDLPDPQKRHTKRKEYTYRYQSKLDRPEYKERPVWSTVVTRNARLRAEAAAAAAAAAKTGIAVGHAGRPGVAAGPTALVGPALPRAEFTRAQIGALHAMISDHVQLLLTTFARGAWDVDPIANAAAQRAHKLLGQMLETVRARLMAKDAAKDPPHVDACFARAAATAAGSDADGSRRWLPPPRPGNARVYTVLDVMPLRMAGKFTADVRACGLVMRVPPGRRLPLIALPQVMLPPPSAAGAAGAHPAVPRVPSPEELRDAQNAMETRYGRLSQLFRAEHAEPTEADFLDDWRRTNEAETRGGAEGNERLTARRKRRKPPPDEMVPFYVRLPASVVLASRPLARWVNPHVLPRVPNLRIDWEKDRWLPSEDALLAAGIENYGVRWDVIRVNLLPAKTAKQIINRQKNLCNETRFKGANVVRDAKQKVLQPLSAAEIRAIREILHRDNAVAGGENWDAIQRERLPNRNPSCLDRLWKEAHPRGLVASEPYPEPGAPLLLASAEGVGTAPIDMINSSFHDHNVSIHVPRKAKLRLGAEAAAEPARFHPSLFGGEPAEAPAADAFGVAGARQPTDTSPAKPFATRASPRRRGDPPATSLLFGRLEDSRDAGLGFGLAGARAPASPAAAATQREMARALFSPSKVPEALRSPPKSMGTRDADRDRDPAHAPGEGVDFEQEALHDTDSDGDDDASRGAWARRGRGRPSRAAVYAEKAMQDRAARVAAEREALPSSDDESHGSLGAEREDIVSESSEDARAERSDLEDSDDEDAGGNRSAFPRAPGAAAEMRDASGPPPPSIVFGSLESTMPLPDDNTHNPFLHPNVAGSAERAPKQHAWSAEQDHAVLVAAQTSGVEAATWERLVAAGGACRGATAAQVEARFAWLCDAAKKQKCAARGGKQKGKPHKAQPRRRDA